MPPYRGTATDATRRTLRRHGNLSPGVTVPFDPGYVTRKALTIRHVDRYEGRYLHKSLTFLAEHQEKYPFDALVDATFTRDSVEEALEISLAREVTRAAILMHNPAG